MTARSRILVMVMALVVLGLMAIIANYQIPYDTILWVEIQNTGHTPFFGVIALLILGISTQSLGGRIKSRLLHYVIALTVTVLLGLISEYIQIAGPRDADVWDFVRDVAGAVSFLGLYMWWEGSLSRKTRVIAGLIAAGVLLASLAPLAWWTTAHLGRNASFPVICDFESYWTTRFISTREARFRVVDSPVISASERGRAARVTFQPVHFSELTVREPYPDWRGNKSLFIDVFSEYDSAVLLHVRVEDFAHNDDFSDRFNRVFEVHKGLNRISIPLGEIQSAPAGREMEMCSIRAIRIFTGGLETERTLYIDNIRLD